MFVCSQALSNLIAMAAHDATSFVIKMHAKTRLIMRVLAGTRIFCQAGFFFLSLSFVEKIHIHKNFYMELGVSFTTLFPSDLIIHRYTFIFYDLYSKCKGIIKSYH